MAKFCTNCGKPLTEGARFCRSCGAQVAGDTGAFRDENSKASPVPEEAVRPVGTPPPSASGSRPDVTPTHKGRSVFVVVSVIIVAVIVMVIVLTTIVGALFSGAGITTGAAGGEYNPAGKGEP